MFVISFSLHFNELNDRSSPQRTLTHHLLSSSCPEVEGESLFIPLYYIRACKSKTYLILKNIFNRVQN